MNIKIRTLKPEEIEVRVQKITDKGVSLLLYKNARVDMVILDELFGVTGWQRRHDIINGSNYCTVSICDKETGEWISKMDVGTESLADPVKGEASDAFKRACTNIGIGRELYTAPFIWVPAERVNIQNNGKLIVKDSFHVSDIDYDNRRSISSIQIMNQRDQIVFSMERAITSAASGNRKGISSTSVNNNKKVKAVNVPHINSYQAGKLLSAIKEHDISLDAVLKKHKLSDISEMPVELYEKAMLTLCSGDAA